MTRDVLRQRSAEHFTSPPLCAPREALDFLKHLVGNRHRCLHTVSIIAAESHKPRSTTYGILLDRLSTTGVHDYAPPPVNPHVRACNLFAQSRASTSWPRNQRRPLSGLVRIAEVGSSGFLPSTNFSSQ